MKDLQIVRGFIQRARTLPRIDTLLPGGVWTETRGNKATMPYAHVRHAASAVTERDTDRAIEETHRIELEVLAHSIGATGGDALAHSAAEKLAEHFDEDLDALWAAFQTHGVSALSVLVEEGGLEEADERDVKGRVVWVATRAFEIKAQVG